LGVTADASASSDTDATPIADYRFNFGDGTPVVGPQAGATATHTYTTAGTYTVTVTVTDTAGQASTASAQVVVKTNFVTNGGFETDLSGWNTSGSGSNITLARVSGGHAGSWSAKLTNTGTTTSTFATLQDSPNWVTATTAGTYTGSAWVRSDTAGAILKIKLQEYNGSTLISSANGQVTLSTAWQQVSVPYVIRSPGSTLDLQLYVANPAPGTAFYADDISVVVG
jgi:PKD repeat protein